MSSRRLALVAPGLFNGGDGGVERVASWLRAQLLRRGDYDVSIVSVATSSKDATSLLGARPRSWRRPQHASFEWQGADAVHFGAWFGEVEYARYLPRRELTRHLARYDIIQVVCGTPAWGVCALNAGPPVALQVATTVRAERAHRPTAGLADQYRRLSTRVVERLESRALNGAAHVFVENNWMYAECVRAVEGRLSLTPPGVDSDFFTPRTGYANGDRYILTVGRFGDSRKNLPGLLRSYARARSNGMSHRMVVAGAGTVPPALFALTRALGVADVVVFEESVSELRLRELYRGAAVFALASFEEGLGLVLLEAQACGTPVVATATEGAKEVAARGAVGTIVPLFDEVSEEMAAALKHWAQHDDPASVRARSRNVIEREFGNEVALARFTEVYDRLLGGVT